MLELYTEVPHFPNPPISSLSIGPFTVHLYALCILLGIIVAYAVGASRFKKRGGDSGTLLDIVLWAVPFGIVGARAFHVVTHLGDYVGVYPTFQETLLHMVSIWEGGIAIYGALIFGTLGAWVGASVSGVRFVSVLDALAPGVILAQGIGRWGNYFNQELFGQATDLPWGLLIEKNGNAAFPSEFPAGTLFHPTFLYEFIWDVLGFFLIIFVAKKWNLQWGKVFALYLVVYSIGRYFVESIRLDPSDVFFGLRTNQWSAVAGVMIGIAIFMIQSRRHTGIEPDVYLPGRRPTEDSETETEKPVA